MLVKQHSQSVSPSSFVRQEVNDRPTDRPSVRPAGQTRPLFMSLPRQTDIQGSSSGRPANRGLLIELLICNLESQTEDLPEEGKISLSLGSSVPARSFHLSGTRYEGQIPSGSGKTKWSLPERKFNSGSSGATANGNNVGRSARHVVQTDRPLTLKFPDTRRDATDTTTALVSLKL